MDAFGLTPGLQIELTELVKQIASGYARRRSSASRVPQSDPQFTRLLELVRAGLRPAGQLLWASNLLRDVSGARAQYTLYVQNLDSALLDGNVSVARQSWRAWAESPVYMMARLEDTVLALRDLSQEDLDALVERLHERNDISLFVERHKALVKRLSRSSAETVSADARILVEDCRSALRRMPGVGDRTMLRDISAYWRPIASR